MDLADFTSYGGGFSGRCRFGSSSVGLEGSVWQGFVLLSVFGLLSRSKWTLSASNQYPKVV